MNPYLLDRLEEMNPSGRSGTWEIQNDQSLKEVVPPSQEELDNYKKYYLASIDKQLPFETILRSDLQDKKIDEERFDKFIKIYNQQQKLQKQYNQELKDQALFDLGSRLSGDIPRYTEENPARLANGGSPEQELINTRIEELLMADPVNEMRATTPDMFERQKLGIEGLLSNLYEPRRARDIAETISTGIDFTPLGDPAALAEGFQMMGDDQPLMGAALMAGSVFTNMPANKLKGLLKKAEEKLDSLRQSEYTAKSKMKPGLSKADFDEGFKDNIKIQSEKGKVKKEIDEINKALNPTVVPDSGTKKRSFIDELAEQSPAFKKMLVEGRKDEGYIKAVPSKTPKQVKGIVNATPETKRLYQEILDSPSAINTPRHKKVREETSEQFREIQKGIKDADLEDRNELIRLLARLKDKKSK